jgi:nucleoside-diphosphate kinase
MRSSPVVILILQGENAINRIRDLLGPTDSTIAPKGTIRGDLGTDRMQNIAHASDGVDAAKAEIARFFGKDEIFN